MVFPLLLIVGILITLVARKLLLNKKYFFQKKNIIILLGIGLAILLMRGGINAISFVISGTIIIAALIDRIAIFKKKEMKSLYDHKMTVDNARQILGVSETASEEEIKEAYVNLIKKNHPDHGGSNYLATQINEAKEILLNEENIQHKEK